MSVRGSRRGADLRRDADGSWGAEAQFIVRYGEEKGVNRWIEADTVGKIVDAELFTCDAFRERGLSVTDQTAERRRDSNGNGYTESEFADRYTMEHPDRWLSAMTVREVCTDFSESA